MRNIIGSKIQQARRQKHLTQEQLAAHLQMAGLTHTRNTVAKIEGGIRQVTDVEIKVIADVLGVRVAWLFDEV
jgi:transcriptional regulator with XRE-family HTH domain